MAKRNKTNHREPRSGTSPYVKYSKAPYLYPWQSSNNGPGANFVREHRTDKTPREPRYRTLPKRIAP